MFWPMTGCSLEPMPWENQFSQHVPTLHELVPIANAVMSPTRP